jgi:hypothetical protein
MNRFLKIINVAIMATAVSYAGQIKCEDAVIKEGIIASIKDALSEDIERTQGYMKTMEDVNMQKDPKYIKFKKELEGLSAIHIDNMDLNVRELQPKDDMEKMRKEVLEKDGEFLYCEYKAKDKTTGKYLTGKYISRKYKLSDKESWQKMVMTKSEKGWFDR